jgi:S1-C subfamily serine protease
VRSAHAFARHRNDRRFPLLACRGSFEVSAVLLVLAILSNAPAAPCPGWLGLGFLYHPPARTHIDGWIYVQRLAPRGPAERGGLLPGDVITAIDGQPVRYIDDLSLLQRLSRISAGAVIHFTFRRGIQSGAVAITAGVASNAQCAAWRQSFEMARAKPPR